MKLGMAVRVALALVLVAALAACARIPLLGPVSEGQALEDSVTQGVRLLPDPPEPGASPEQIVRGFLEAGTGTQGNYATARSFLTDDLSGSWDPTARVLVHQGQATYTLIDPDTVHVQLTVIAEIDSSGAYTALEEPTARTLEYQVRSDTGEWRVSAAEPGLVLMAMSFDLVFEPFTLYFFDSTLRYLVPDVRWFPNHTTAPTRIVQAILAGPTTWLAEGSVASAFPVDTVLRGPVTTESGVASADFSQTISTASNDLFSLMLLQLRESLIGLGGIDDVRMSANGAPLDVQDPPEGAVHSHAQVNATPLVYRNGELGYLSGETLTPPTGSERLVAMLPNLGATRGTISVEQGLGAFLTPSGVMAIPFATGQPVSIDARQGVVPPSIDPFGYVWTVSTEEHHVFVGDVAGEFFGSFELGAYGADGVLSLQVSRDGARVAALVRDGTTVRLVVASIERRDGAAEPTGIAEPVVIPVGAGTPQELTWVDETSVGILVADGQGATTVRVQRIGGEAQDRGAVEGGAQIAGSNTLAGLRVVDSSGSLFVPRGNRWQPQGAKIDWLATQA